MDIERRDTIIFGAYEPEKYKFGIRNFDNLTLSQLELLLEEGFIDDGDFYNDSPDVETYKNFMKQYDGYKAIGHVDSQGKDSRITIEGLVKDILGETPDEVAAFAQYFHDADDFRTNKESGMYCWYD